MMMSLQEFLVVEVTSFVVNSLGYLAVMFYKKRSISDVYIEWKRLFEVSFRRISSLYKSYDLPMHRRLNIWHVALYRDRMLELEEETRCTCDNMLYWNKIIAALAVSGHLCSSYVNNNIQLSTTLYIFLAINIFVENALANQHIYFTNRAITFGLMEQMNTEDNITVIDTVLNEIDPGMSIALSDDIANLDDVRSVSSDATLWAPDYYNVRFPLPEMDNSVLVRRLSDVTFDLDNLEHFSVNSGDDDISDLYDGFDDNDVPMQVDHSGLRIGGLTYEQSRDIHHYWMLHYVHPEMLFGLEMTELATAANNSVQHDFHNYDNNNSLPDININGLDFQSGEIEFQSDDYGLSKLYIEVNQKNVRRKHFRDKKMDKNNKDIDNAKAALRFLKQTKASKSDKHRVIKAISDTRDADPKLHKEIMKEVRGKLDFHSGFYDKLTEQFIWNEINGALNMCTTTVFQKHLEGLILLVLNAMQCVTWTHFMTTILAYIGNKVDNSLYGIISEYLQSLFSDEDEPLEFHSSFMDKLKNVSETIKTGLNSKFCSKVFSFMGLLTTLSMTSYLNLPFSMGAYLEYMASAVKNIVTKGDVIQQLIEHSMYLYEKGIMFFKTKDLSMVFYDIDDANAYQMEYSDLKAYEYLMDAGCLEQFGTSIASYSRRVDELTIRTENMLKGCRDDRTRAFIGAKKQTLLTLKYKLLVAFRKMSMRIKPYTILLSGESGVGKTVAKDLLIQVIAGSNPDYFTVEDMIVSSINDDDAYMTEATNQTQVLVVDDAGNTQPMYAEKAITKTVIHASNNEPKAIIKAKVEEKGAHYMNFNCIMMTTNKPDLHSKTYTVDPTSVLRRFEVIITVRIKQEYRQQGSYMLDVSKTNGMEMDVWEFDVKRAYKKVEDNSVGYVIPKNEDGLDMCDVDINTLLKFLSWDSKKHFTRQKSLLTEHAVIRKMKMCPHGSLVSICREDGCRPEFQAGSSFLLKTGLAMYLITSLLSRVYHFTNWLMMCALYYRCMRRFLVRDISWKKYFSLIYFICIGATYSMNIWMGTVGILSIFYGVMSTIPLTITLGLYTFSNKMRNDINDISMTTWFKANKFYSNNKRLSKTLLAMGSVLSVYGIVRIIKKVIDHNSVIDLQVKETVNTEFEQNVQTPNTEFHGGMASCLQQPVNDASPRLNPYLIPVVQKVDVDHKVRTMTLEQALTVLKRNQSLVVNGTQAAGIFPICQNHFLINRHMLGKGEGSIKVYRDGMNQLGRNFEAKYSRETWRRINQTDICVIYLPNGGSQKDLRHMFPKEYTRTSRSCLMSIKNVDGSYESTRFHAHCKLLKHTHPTLDYEINTPALEYQADIPLINGMCMSPLLSLGLSPYIVGFHCMGVSGTGRGVANQVTLEDVQGAINEMELDDESIVFQSHSFTNIQRDVPATGHYIDAMINRKSAVNYLTKGSCHIYGTLNRPSSTMKTKVKDTFISPDVEELFNQPNEFCGPPKLNSWEPRHAELEAITDTCDVNPRILTMAYQDMRSHFLRVIDKIPNWKDKIHPIDNNSNLAGCDGVYGVNSINLNTSTGFPLYTKKNKIIVHNPDIEIEGISRPLQMDQSHWDEVDAAEEILATGDRVNFIHTASTKDEPKKKGSEKVRVFYVTPLTCLLLCRRYFLMVAKLFMDFALLLENTVGINTHSLDWDNIVEKLLVFGFDRFVNGDFKKYDSKMPVMINLSTFKFIIELCWLSGNFTERMMNIMRGLATEVCLPILNFFLTVLMCFGSTISGHSLTICLNSIDNSLIMRYAFYKIFDDKYKGDFSKYVVLFTNGDDNIMSVSKELDGFNHTTIQAALAEDGIIYTMADKEADSVPFLPLSDTSYLKRRFTYSAQYRRWMCPIEEKSIFKSLHNYIPSKVQTKEQHAVEVMNNALREYFYYGRPKFEEVRSKLMIIVDRHRLRCELDTGELLTYENVEDNLYTTLSC